MSALEYCKLDENVNVNNETKVDANNITTNYMPLREIKIVECPIVNRTDVNDDLGPSLITCKHGYTIKYKGQNSNEGKVKALKELIDHVKKTMLKEKTQRSQELDFLQGELQEAQHPIIQILTEHIGDNARLCREYSNIEWCSDCNKYYNGYCKTCCMGMAGGSIMVIMLLVGDKTNSIYRKIDENVIVELKAGNDEKKRSSDTTNRTPLREIKIVEYSVRNFTDVSVNASNNNVKPCLIPHYDICVPDYKVDYKGQDLNKGKIQVLKELIDDLNKSIKDLDKEQTQKYQELTFLQDELKEEIKESKHPLIQFLKPYIGDNVNMCREYSDIEWCPHHSSYYNNGICKSCQRLQWCGNTIFILTIIGLISLMIYIQAR